MNQPVFKQGSYTPPANCQHPFPTHAPHIAPTFTPHHPNHQLLTYPNNPNVPRPPNFLHTRPPTAHSTIFPTHAPPPDPNRTLKLESFGRKASFQEQNVRPENATISAIRQQHGIISQQPRLSNPVSSPPPPHMRKPLYTSQLFPSNETQPELPPRKSETADLRGSFPLFASEISQMQENLNSLKLKFKNGEFPNRQSKTDRDQPAQPSPTSTVPLGPNLKFRQTTNGQPQRPIFLKGENVSMDSTQNSSKNLSSNTDSKSSQPYLSTIKKTSPPPNFWPLSISPCEQKRQNLLSADLMGSGQAEGKDRAEEMVEFRKRKYSELANRKKSTYQYPKKIYSLQDFQLLDKIGKGSFGDVYIAQEKASGFVCVLKKLLKKKLVEMKLEEHLVREIKIQSFLKHRHLTSLYGFFHDETYIYLILEIMPDGSLMQVKKKRKIPESEVSTYVRQICEGLKYMHTEEIIHRDIKPENIFLNDGYAKIGDFGCSIFTHSLRNTVVGSLAYISPEQLKQGFYNEKIDVWSLGVMTYEMLLGKSPYQEDIIKIARQEMAPQLSELKFPNEADLSPEVKDFITQTLHIDASQRIGIVEALKHEFIRKHEKKEEKASEKQSL